MAQQQIEVTENLAKMIDKEELSKIGSKCVDEYDIDLASRSDWDAKRKRFLKLFAGYRDPKSFPWDGCSNTHIPWMGIACLQFQARAYEALLPPKEYAKCFPTDGKALDAADRCSKYMNWQLTEQMEEWEEDMDVTLLWLAINGSAYKKTYFDPIKKRNMSIYISAESFVTPYKCRRIEDAPRKTHAFYKSIDYIKRGIKEGVYIDIGDITPTTDVSMPSSEISDQNDKTSNQSVSDAESLGLRFLLEQHRGLDLNGDGILEDYIVTVDYESRKVLRIESGSYIDPITGEVKRDEFFTGYVLIPNAESHYGFGFGHLLESINETGNTILNQLIDAGTFQNAPPGFYNKKAGLNKGKFTFAPNTLNPVDIGGDDVKKAIYYLEHPGPSTALFSVLGLLQNYGKEISSLPDALLGKLPPSDTTATSMLAVMEQGMKVFSTIHKRLHRSFRKELKKLFRLNSRFMDEHVYYVVQDSSSKEFKTLESGKKDFINPIDVIPVSDPSITSRAEKLIKARQAYEVGIGNPLIKDDPQSLYNLTYSFYKAIETPNIETFLKMPPPPPEPPDFSPIQENGLFLQEKEIHPLATQDHNVHMQTHSEFKQSGWFNQLTPYGKKLFEQHERETMTFLYMQEEQKRRQAMMMMASGGMVNAQPGGTTGMEVTPGYARILEGIGRPEK